MGAHVKEQEDERAPSTAGYRTIRRLGAGGSGEVWLLRDDDGGWAALKVLVDAASSPAGRAEGWRAASVVHPHVLRTRGMVEVSRKGPDGGGSAGTGLLMDFAPGGSVATLVSVRGRLTPGETVTVIAPIAQALAALHAQGVVHGDVAPGNVLFTAEGKPLLSDFGQSLLTGEEGPERRRVTRPFSDPAVLGAASGGSSRRATAEGDVYSLAAVAWWCLTGRPPGETAGRVPLPVLHPEVPKGLALAVEAGLDEDSAKRPSAAEFGRAVQRACPALPVQIAAGAHEGMGHELVTSLLPGDLERRQRHPGLLRGRPAAFWKPERRPQRGPKLPRRRAVWGLVSAGLLVALLFVGLGTVGALARQTPSPVPVPAAEGAQPGAGTPSSSGPAASGRQEEPRAAAERLVAARTRALERREADSLAAIYLPGAALDRDRALISGLLESRLHYTGFVTAVSESSVRPGATGERAEVEATVTTPGFAVEADPVQGEGAQPAPGKGTGPREGRAERVVLVLRAVAGEWRIEQVLPRP